VSALTAAEQRTEVTPEHVLDEVRELRAEVGRMRGAPDGQPAVALRGVRTCCGLDAFTVRLTVHRPQTVAIGPLGPQELEAAVDDVGHEHAPAVIRPAT
jgi:hypothetical protein